MCIEGYGPKQIANILEEDKVLIPNAHKIENGFDYTSKVPNDPYNWSAFSVSSILSKKEYLGHTVNFKFHNKSYKSKKSIKNDESEWMIFENTHEAIIDQETFDIVQKIRDGRRRWTPMGEMPLLSGMVYCADCGSKMYQVRARSWTHDKEYMVCANYRKKGKDKCESHSIRNVVLEQLILKHLKAVTYFAREHEDEFVAIVTKTTEKTAEKEIRESKKEYEQAKARISKLDTIIQKLYEDNVDGQISDERFVKMSATYENEQKELTSRVSELHKIITEAHQNSLNADSFLALVRKYTDIEELNAEIIRSFIERINVYKAEKIDGQKQQRVQIIFRCIGEFYVPSEEKTA